MCNEATTNNESKGNEAPVKKEANKAGKSERNKVNAKLMAAIGSETDPQRIAFIVSKFNAAEARERERQRSRKAFVTCLKLNKGKVNADRIEDLAFEFAKAKSGDFREYLLKNHTELFEVNKPEVQPVGEA